MKQPVVTLWFSYQIREERERLQLRYNELGLSLVTAQEELTEARTLAGANAVATASMARQIEVLVEDQILRRQELQTAGSQYHFRFGRSVKTPDIL